MSGIKICLHCSFNIIIKIASYGFNIINFLQCLMRHTNNGDRIFLLIYILTL